MVRFILAAVVAVSAAQSATAQATMVIPASAVPQTTVQPAAQPAPAPPQSFVGKMLKKGPPIDYRADYLSRLHETLMPPPSARTTGSLWSSANSLGDLSADYKAHNVNDMVVILVSVQTTAAQSGSVNSQRAFTTSSGITALPGDLKVKGVNPLFGANSTNTLKGQGATASNTTFQTSLTGQVVAVLANGNMVVEAERKISMNNQHEDVVVRGIVRPGDISPSNIVASSSLSNLEIEMKGKGIISDSVRSPNPIMKAIMWLFNF